MLFNLTADKDGLITIPRDALGNRQHLQIVAVDPEQTLVRWLSLPEQKIEVIDLRLAKGLDPKSHFMQQKQVSLVPGGKELIVPDVSGSRFEVYDSLARVYGLYVTLTQGSEAGRVRLHHALEPSSSRRRSGSSTRSTPATS